MMATRNEGPASNIGDALPSAKDVQKPLPLATKVPPAAKWLGVFGVIPFVFLAPAAPFLEASIQESANFALAAYGAIILSFLGGIHWGLATATAGSTEHNGTTSIQLGVSVVPSRVGWGALVAFVLLVFSYAKPGFAAAEDAALWRALSSKGHVALLRHALAPGTGDPPNFAVGDCSTQRNLSEEGRAQAERIGDRFRENGIETARVVSSQWCRCLDTAKLLGLGSAEEQPLLNSFYQQPERRAPQMQTLNEWLAGQELDGPVVFVTHQVNISALTSHYATSGELVIIRIAEKGKIEVLGSIETD